MKKILFTLVFTACLAAAGHAQSLQFSRAILITTTTVQTVPTGTVWKVEQYLQQNNFRFDYVNSGICSPSSTYGRFTGVVINGVTYYLKQLGVNNSGINPASLFGINGALWLPAGTTINLTCANDLLNLLEFNIVP